MRTPTRPKEFICFSAVPVPTEKDGTVYFFIAVDAYTQFAFNLGVTTTLDDDTVLEHIQNLLQDPDFIKNKGPYTLVMLVGEHLREQIEVLIQPLGKLQFDEQWAADIILPVLKEIGLLGDQQ